MPARAGKPVQADCLRCKVRSFSEVARPLRGLAGEAEEDRNEPEPCWVAVRGLFGFCCGMGFDRLAPHYRWLEALFAGGRLQRCRVALLDALPPPRNVLVFGEGNGRFLAEFLRRFPDARVTVVEASGVMIGLARSRLRSQGLDPAAVEFVQTDALAWEPRASSFDLVVTCFFLDCFREDQLRLLIPRIRSAVRDDARWLVADFQIAASGLRRVWGRFIVGMLYRFFRMATRLPARELVDPAALLQASGFTCERRREQDHGLLYSAVWRLAATSSQARAIP